ncbi:MAG TPA: carbamoyltransferase [Thermoanaerobaculia bacterium]|nr:carbamoyltransferase [Thermoanaerobaculia bacterium]
MNIIGISAGYHESSCCLLQEGRLVAAASEERFTRLKHDPGVPLHAFRFCLERGGIGLTDIDAVAYYEIPAKKLARQLWAGRVSPGLPWLDALRAERTIRESLGWEGPILSFEHHHSHAASAFFFSGYEEAAILTVDGVGEWATTTYGRGAGDSLDIFEEVRFPHSLGLLYSALTSYLGFRVNGGEYKVMGLAPYGEPRHVDRLRRLVQPGPRGQYTLDLQYFDFIRGERMYSPALCDLLGAPPRVPESPMEQFHQDVARSLQVLLEEILLEKVRYLAGEVGSPNLCMAGGVALNCVANARILREGPFERLFVQPAAGDAGGSLGAAALAHRQLTGRRPAAEPMRHAYLGPSYEAEEIARLIEAAGIQALDFRGREGDLLQASVDRLAAGRVLGWFQGAMEFGPRALGSRSLLADPRDPQMRERLNRQVKKREAFRPFAPIVREERAAAHLDLDHPSPFMLETCQVRSPLALPAITHVDGSARPQTVDREVAPRLAALLDAFEARTGCPILLNTSFNVRGEPVVCSPVDALICMAVSGIDTLVLEDWIIDRESLPGHWPELVDSVEKVRGGVQPRASISEMVYTFI